MTAPIFHPEFPGLALGLGPLRVDPRTIAYRTMAPDPWTPPPSYDWDTDPSHAPSPLLPRMYLNDVEGDCVIAGQANHMTRFEFDELGHAIEITDAEVHAEYRAQTGGADVGLDPITSLSRLRSRGWRMAGKVRRIHGWARVYVQDHQQADEAAIVGSGLQVAVSLPLSSGDQMNAREPWDVVGGSRGAPGSWGRHMIYQVAFDRTRRRLTFWTWGKRQEATERWVDEYTDFAALLIDQPDALEAPVASRFAGMLAERVSA